MIKFALLLAFVADVSAYVIGSGVQANPSGCNLCAPVAGVWSQWGPWSGCQNSYGAYSKTRTRQCTGGGQCQGSTSESQSCSPPVQYDPAPQWGQWGPWSQCSATCGGGQCTRQRVCNNGCSTCNCVGESQESTSCNTQPCCSWGQWSGWSACSATCGSSGVQSRTRQCSCVSGCTGQSSEQQQCNAQNPCPAPAPVCDTCGVQRDPPPCTTCQPVTPAPCVTCYQVPTCSTCGGAPGPYYNPYGNRRRRTNLKLIKNPKNKTKV